MWKERSINTCLLFTIQYYLCIITINNQLNTQSNYACTTTCCKYEVYHQRFDIGLKQNPFAFVGGGGRSTRILVLIVGLHMRDQRFSKHALIAISLLQENHPLNDNTARFFPHYP